MQWGDEYLADDVAAAGADAQGLRRDRCTWRCVCDAGHELAGARDVRPVRPARSTAVS